MEAGACVWSVRLDRAPRDTMRTEDARMPKPRTSGQPERWQDAMGRPKGAWIMETKWLEDFLTLAETRSFSRAAELRNITQPAFSRRIQALEAWLGAALVDRTMYPTRLTAEGEIFRGEAVSMLAHLSEVRSLLRGREYVNTEAIRIAMPHTLSLAFFPDWIKRVEQRVGPLSTKVTALNVHDAAMSLVEGIADIALLYHHPHQPVQLEPRRFKMLTIGVEAIYPYSCCNENGEALFDFPGKEGRIIPFLSYAPNAYLKRMVDYLLSEITPKPRLEIRCETDMAEGLKSMLLEGHGIAFLPENAVRRELAAGLLVCVDERYSTKMEIRAYCGHRESESGILGAIWKHMADDAGAGASTPHPAA